MQSGLRIRSQKDLAAGILYLVVGAAFAIGAFNYNIGDASRMGPGYFPLAVGALLAIVGLVTAASSVRASAPDEAIKRPDLASMGWILGSVVLFGLMLQHAGLVLSLLVLVVVGSRGSHEFKWKTAILNAIVLTVFSIGVFIYGISLQIPLWPDFVQ